MITDHKKAWAIGYIQTEHTDWTWNHDDYGFANVPPTMPDGLEVERYACTGQHWNWVPDSIMSWDLATEVIQWMEEGLSMDDIGKRIHKVGNQWELVQ